jgi:glycosyltransferase involved in cell wall biosynthesis
MKILIDATPLLLQSAGVKGHLHEWIAAVRDAAPEGTIRTWPSMPPANALDHTRSQASRWATCLGIGSFLASYKLGLPAYELLLPGADVFHACIMQTHIPRGRRVTSTVFDMTPLLMPDQHTPENVQAFTAHADHVLKRAHLLTSVSSHSRLDAIRLLGLHPDRIVTIPSVVGGRYAEATDADAASARAEFALAKPFVLVVGTIEPRKNLDRLLDVWQDLPPRYREEYDLVLAGSPGWRSERTLARLKAKPESVRWLGYVAENWLPGLSRAAVLLAYPSLYEGFGLPPAQALAAGTPVLSSLVSSLPEVVGPGGLLVDPRSNSELAAALTRLLDSDSLRQQLAQQGREHVLRNFSHAAVGAASVRFFERACG